MSAGQALRGGGLRWRLVAAAVAGVVLVTFVGANAHLIYVAVASQPDCVPHRTGPDGSPAAYRAAKPSC